MQRVASNDYNSVIQAEIVGIKAGAKGASHLTNKSINFLMDRQADIIAIRSTYTTSHCVRQ